VEQGDPPRDERSAAALLGIGVSGGAVVALAVWFGLGALSTEPPRAMAPPRFVDEAVAAGIHHTYDGGFTYFVGGGVAAFDCDVDGRPDLYFAGGTDPAGLYRNVSPVGGALRFAHVPAPATDLTKVVGAYPLDIEGDGRTDLVVLRVGEDAVLRGIGDCRFERANERWNIDGGDSWTAAFSATWEGDAGLPTLAFGNYLDLAENGDEPTCDDSAIVRPIDGGTTYADPLLLEPAWCTLSVLFSDWSRTGHADLRMSNDRHYSPDAEEQLWRVEPGDTPRLYTREEGWQRLPIWGMGIASYDVTGDGLPEVYLTSQADNKLQTLANGPGEPNYRDIALRRGVTAHRPYLGGEELPSTAWHPEFQDVNNDGFIDLFVSKGNVEAQPDFASKDPSDLLLGQPNGSFVERGGQAGVATFVRGRGAALIDLNLDGMLDLVQVNRRVNVSVWRNVGWGDADRPVPMGSWVAVRLEQPGPNRDAIGSWVEVRFGDRTAEREVTVGGGHAGGQLGWIHFGVGDADHVGIRVRWPDGHAGPWHELDANTWATIERGTSEPMVWTPPRQAEDAPG
jgi:enediyne biosynthesis protein E4